MLYVRVDFFDVLHRRQRRLLLPLHMLPLYQTYHPLIAMKMQMMDDVHDALVLILMNAIEHT
jgi:hypothetical protein